MPNTQPRASPTSRIVMLKTKTTSSRPATTQENHISGKTRDTPAKARTQTLRMSRGERTDGCWLPIASSPDGSTVGTPVSPRPPYRPRRAIFPHRVPQSCSRRLKGPGLARLDICPQPQVPLPFNVFIRNIATQARPPLAVAPRDAAQACAQSSHRNARSRGAGFG